MSHGGDESRPRASERRCTVCGYVQHGSTTRCPECGLDFDEQLLAQRMRHVRPLRALGVGVVLLLLPIPFAIVISTRLGAFEQAWEWTTTLPLVIGGIALWTGLVILTLVRQWKRVRRLDRASGGEDSRARSDDRG